MELKVLHGPDTQRNIMSFIFVRGETKQGCVHLLHLIVYLHMCPSSKINDDILQRWSSLRNESDGGRTSSRLACGTMWSHGLLESFLQHFPSYPNTIPSHGPLLMRTTTRIVCKTRVLVTTCHVSQLAKASKGWASYFFTFFCYKFSCTNQFGARLNDTDLYVLFNVCSMSWFFKIACGQMTLTSRRITSVWSKKMSKVVCCGNFKRRWPPVVCSSLWWVYMHVRNSWKLTNTWFRLITIGVSQGLRNRFTGDSSGPTFPWNICSVLRLYQVIDAFCLERYLPIWL